MGNGNLNGHPVIKDGPNKKIIRAKSPPQIHDLANLRMEKFPALKRVVGEIIVEGCVLLAAGSKVGKTWLMLDACTAVAAGGYTLGDIECTQGDCLFLSLEQGRRSIQRRITKQKGAQAEEWPHVAIAYSWPRAHEGGLGELDYWLTAHPKARLVVIDTFVQFRTPSADGKPNYSKDYEAVSGLQQLATRHEVAIVVLHHTRKANDPDDPVNNALGSVGHTAAADAILVLSKVDGKHTLYGRGRDTEEFDLAIEFNKSTCRWRLLGDRIGVEQNRDRDAIVTVLASAKESVKTADIVAAVGKGRTHVMNTLARLVEAGEILREKHGAYRLAIDAGQERQLSWWNN